MVGVSGLRFGQTGGSSTNEPEAQQQQNEPATGDLLNLDGDSSTGPAITLVPETTSTGSGSSPTPPASSSSNPPSSNSSNTATGNRSNTLSSSRAPQQQQVTNSPNRTSLLATAGAVGTAAAVGTAGAVNTGRAVSTTGTVTSGSSSTLPSTGAFFVLCSVPNPLMHDQLIIE